MKRIDKGNHSFKGENMKEDFQNGDLYDVYYTDNNGKEHCVCYFGHCKSDVVRLFESEQCVGEVIRRIVKR